QVHFYVLTATRGVACVQSSKDAYGGVFAGQHVDECNPRLHRRATLGVRVTGNRHETPDGLHEKVIAWQVCAAAAAKSTDGTVDSAGVGLVHLLVPEVESIERAGA